MDTLCIEIVIDFDTLKLVINNVHDPAVVNREGEAGVLAHIQLNLAFYVKN